MELLFTQFLKIQNLWGKEKQYRKAQEFIQIRPPLKYSVYVSGTDVSGVKTPLEFFWH